MQFISKKYLAILSIIFISSKSVLAMDLKIVHQDYLPFAGKGDGPKIGGAFHEIAESVICKKLGHKCTYEIAPIRRAEKMIVDGEAHLFLAMVPNPDRRKTMFFSSSLSASESTFFVMKGKAGSFKKIEDFGGKKVGLFGPSALSILLAKLNEPLAKKITIEEDSDPAQPLRKLNGSRYGEDGGVFANSAVGSLQVRQENLNVEMVTFKGTPTFHSISMSKKSLPEAEAKKIFDALGEFVKSEEYKKILKQWQINPFEGKAFDGPNG